MAMAKRNKKEFLKKNVQKAGSGFLDRPNEQPQKVDHSEEEVTEELIDKTHENIIEGLREAIKGKEKPKADTSKKKRPTKNKAGEVRYSVLIKEELLDKVRDIAKEQNAMIKEVINQAIIEYLEGWKSKDKDKIQERMKELQEEMKKLKRTR